MQFHYNKKLDDSAFLRTQSYITEICYFEFLWSFEFWLAPHWDPPIYPNAHTKLTKIKIRSSLGQFKYCSESLIEPIGSHIWSLFAPIHIQSWPEVKLGQVQVGSNIAQNHSFSP